MTSDRPSTTLATAIAGRHLGFCRRLAAAWRRAAAGRLGVQRVFARIASICSIESSVHTQTFATTVMSAPRLLLTLAPKIRIDLHPTVSTASPMGSRPFEGEHCAPSVTASHPLGCATTVVRMPQRAPDRPGSDPARPALAPLLLQVIERRHREERSVVTHAITSVRRSEVRRLETIVRQPPAPAATPKTEPTPASKPYAEARASGPWASRPQAMPALSGIPDAEVARFTERVVQQINRRILAERERRGR